MVVQHHADDRIFGVVHVELFEQSNELDAAVAILDVGKNRSRVQVNTRQDGYCAVTNVLVITPDADSLARHRRPIGCGQSDGLNTGLLIDADGVDGVGPCLVNSAFGVEGNVPVDPQNFLHLAVKFGVALFQVVANFVRPESL